MDDRFPTIIASIVTGVWTASIILDAVVKAYDPPASVHALMMAAAGWAFGERLIRRRNNDDQE